LKKILRIRIFWIPLFFLLLFSAQFTPNIEIKNAEGKIIPLEEEELRGIKNRPLAKTKERLDKKYYEGFFLLYKIRVKEGSKLIGTYTLVRGPLRITIFQILKETQLERKIWILTTGFYQVGETLEFTTEIKKLEENSFFITAEAVESEDQLNPALVYMNKIENEVILKGYSSNLSLSTIKFKISGKDEMRKPVEITKDFDYLVSQLINPIRIISISITLDPQA